MRRSKIKMLPNFGGSKKPAITEKCKILPQVKREVPVAESVQTNNIISVDSSSENNREIILNTVNDLPKLSVNENMENNITKSEKSNIKENISCTNVISQKSFSDTEEKCLKANPLKEIMCVSDSSNVINKTANHFKPLEKIAARRTRIKGQPIIPLAKKRPTPSIPVKKENNKCDSGNEIKNLKQSLTINSSPQNIHDINNENDTNNVGINNINSTLSEDTGSRDTESTSNISTTDNYAEDYFNWKFNNNKDNSQLNQLNSNDLKTSNNINGSKYMSNDKELAEDPEEELSNMESKTTSKKRSLSEILIKPAKKLVKSVFKEKVPLPVEITKGKKSFLERKQKYRNKLSTGGLERNQMTMFDLIFWNPSSNPMPGSENNETPSIRSRSNTVDENCGAVTTAVEELNAEEEGLQVTNEVDKENTNSKNADDVSSNRGDKEDIDDSIHQESDQMSDNDEETSTLAPQVKIGPNGELIVDEKSLVIQTTAAKNRDKVMSTAEVIEESNETSHYGKWSKRRKRSTEWTRKETARFYKALSSVGTDFSLMETIFAWRSRQELKIKFKKEEKINRHLIDTALNDCTQFDFSIFDESDYDPEEDRKTSKEAEKVEAKRKKELEREQKKSEKEKEKKLKREQEKLDKLRKKKLKTVYKKRKRKKYNKVKKEAQSCIPKSRRDSVVSIEPQEVICEIVYSLDNPVENNYTVREDEESYQELPYSEENSTEEENFTAGDQICIPIVDVGENEAISISQDELNLQIVNVGENEDIALLQTPIQEDIFQPFQVEDVQLNDGASFVSNSVTFPGLDGFTAGTSHGFSGFVEKNSEGQQFISIDTSIGPQKLAVPPYDGPNSKVIVVKGLDPINPTENCYHIFRVTPDVPNNTSPSKAIETESECKS